MEKLTMCRICLVENVRMHIVADSHLQVIFEKLTNIPFITEDSRPMLACFFCYARLKQCYKFWQKCVEAEAVFTQMLDEEYEQKPMQADLEFFGGFIKTSIEHISIADRQQDDETEDKGDIKEELTGGCETMYDVEIKVECHSDASEQETKDDTYPDFADNPARIGFQSDSEDDIPLTRMKTAVEQVKKNRRAMKETEAREKSVPVVTKPKLDIRKEKLEDTIPTKDKTNEQATSKVIDVTKNSKFKSVTKIIEPFKGSPITEAVNKRSIINMNSESAAICTNLRNNFNNDCLKSSNRGINIDGVEKYGFNQSYLSNEKFHGFNHTSNLQSHIRTYTGEKPYECEICKCCFTLKADLKRHKRIHTGEKPYKCDVCQSSFNVERGLKRHIRRHTGEKPYKCNICPSSFTEKSRLNVHTRKHTGEKPYKCGTCQTSFTDQANLKRHVRVHTGEKPYKCNICLSSFTEKGRLNIHIRKHTGEKPYKCDICQSSFYEKCHLRRHMRIHTGEKPHKCDICQVSFTDQGNLKKHIRIHTGEKPYKCNICLSSFTEKSHLNAHIRRHTGEKPYKCVLCQSSFYVESGLKRHIRIHTGEKPYKCDTCQASFTDQGNLKKHIRIHTGEKVCDNMSS